ncbi:MAG: prolyl oligopeptidase family serine peptidase [Stagnimonas sp.]|nr:prolyl oligopeptidase family serine peptidase [Stagnimonas sp.]
MKATYKNLAQGLLWASLPAFAWAAGSNPPSYPNALLGAVVDNYFGTPVADPYRWLEDVDAPETLAWVQAQQRLAGPLLAALPERESLKQRLTELWNFERRSPPRLVGATRFYLKNDGLQNQSELMVQVGRGAPRPLLDPNRLSAEGTTALTQWEPNATASTISYALAIAGSDWEVIRFRDVATASEPADELLRVKFSGQAWTKDGRGLVYSRYPEPKPSTEQAGKTFEKLEQHSLYYHRLGQPQAQDLLVHAPEDPSWTVVGDVSDDGRYLYAYVTEGASDNNRLYVYDLGDPLQPQFGAAPVLLLGQDFKRSFTVIGSEGSVLYVLTTDGAPKKRVVAIDIAHPEPANWLSLVPEGGDVIDSVSQIGGQLLVKTLHQASSRLSRYSLSGQKLGEVRLPGIGDVSGILGKPGQPDAYFQFTGFAQPASNYRLPMKSGRLALDWAPKLAFDPADYLTEQVFYTSKDGTRVPMFISYKKGLKKNGANPTLLYGYGGFNIALSPTYSPQNLAWMERGGVYAQPSLRGGGEFGEDWHRAGTKERKQNVFDDFAAAAEYLIAHRYTSARHLGIYGRSNGGLLVAATLNQRPELFAAAVPGVGVLDMLRFHQFTIGSAWRDDYGSSETAEGFAYLYPYSPLHNVKPGRDYPPTLTITADHDDRVVPGHSFKYAAAMQAANAGNPQPQLIRIEERGGHGAGKPVGKKIEEVADVLAFLSHYTK